MAVQIDHGRVDIEQIKRELEDRDRLNRIEVRSMIIAALPPAQLFWPRQGLC